MGAAGTTGAAGAAGGAGGGCGVNPSLGAGTIQMENLCRGVVAVRSGSDTFVSWRLMGYEAMDTGFNVYRNGGKVNAAPVTDSTNYVDAGAPATATYTVRTVVAGVESGDSSSSRAAAASAATWAQNYLSIPLRNSSGYSAGDTSPGDLDGDGQYELVVKEENSPRDPSQDGVTGQPKFAAYKLDGTFMWRVDLGINIRESEHTTPTNFVS
jgi:rhamnogalacturonan endolyase